MSLSSSIEDDGNDSDSSSSSEVVPAIAALAPYLCAYYAKTPRTTSILQGSAYYRELVDSDNERRFYDMARMRRETFFALLSALESTGKITSSERVVSGEKLMIFMRVLAGATNRTCSERWQVAGATITAAVKEVLAAVGALRSLLIKPPIATKHAHIVNSPKFFPYFEDCIGAIDGKRAYICVRSCTVLTCSRCSGTHIPAIVRAVDAPAFRNRKGFISQNVLAACDFDMVLCYVLAGWEGSAHDGRVYNAALSSGFPIVPGKYYLADAGYSLTTTTITPYRGVRYHLKEWSTGNQKPQTKEELFNLRHASLRNVIERAFGVFKKKFPLMQTMRSYSFQTQVELVLAAASIYNFIRRHHEPHGPLDEVDTAIMPDTEQSDISSAYDSDSKAKSFRDQVAARMWTDYLVHIAERDRSVVV
jgi:hypothetical protein